MLPKIKKVIFEAPATVVLWEDGTKTVVKAGDYDVYDPEKGLAMAISKKALGNNYHYYDIFRQWLAFGEERDEVEPTYYSSVSKWQLEVVLSSIANRYNLACSYSAFSNRYTVVKADKGIMFTEIPQAAKDEIIAVLKEFNKQTFSSIDVEFLV